MSSQSACDRPPLEGLVTRKNRGQYTVLSDGHSIPCALSAKLWKTLVYPTADPASLRRRVVDTAKIDEIDPIAVGDRVEFVDTGDGTWQIVGVLPRKSKLVRDAASGKVGVKPASSLEQVIVANVDQIVPVMALTRPKPSWILLDRYLVAAESLGFPSIICLTKADQKDDDDLPQEIAIYEQIGYPVYCTSSVTGSGIQEFTQALQGRISVLVGKSGVGKTSLLNAVLPELGLPVGEVSAKSGEGKHTTSHLEMFAMQEGGGIVDTPGMRTFGPREQELETLDHCFPEMQPYLGDCRFGTSCRHDSEPGCAIKQAVDDGRISQLRYKSYRRLASE